MKDKDLIYRLQKGDMSAFEEIYLTYYAPLREYSSHFVEDDKTEEIVSDLMLHIWESRKKIEIHTSLKYYLFTAIKFRSLNIIKKRQTRQKIHTKLYDELKDQFDSPDFYLENELAEAIENAIEELPEVYKETFKLSRFGIETNAQLADKMNVSVKTIEYRITQSIKFLRIRLRDFLLILILILSSIPTR